MTASQQFAARRRRRDRIGQFADENKQRIPHSTAQPKPDPPRAQPSIDEIRDQAATIDRRIQDAAARALKTREIGYGDGVWVDQDGNRAPANAITGDEAARCRVANSSAEDDDIRDAWTDPDRMKELDQQAIDEDGALYYSDEEIPDYDHTLNQSVGDWAGGIEENAGTTDSEDFKEQVTDGVNNALAHHPDIQTKLMPDGRIRLYSTHPRNTRHVDIGYTVTDGRHMFDASPETGGNRHEYKVSYGKQLRQDDYPYTDPDQIYIRTSEFMKRSVAYVDGEINRTGQPYRKPQKD